MFEKSFVRRSNVPEAFNGRKLQKIIGILALSLPFILIIANSLLSKEDCGNPLLSSISAYYYTDVGTYFTGVLFAIALAMFTYKGEREIDKWLANIAAVMAVVVALFPSGIDGPMAAALNNICLLDIAPNQLLGIIHYIAGALLFVALIFFCFLFKLSGPTSGKRLRNKNRFYNFCAIGMIISMIAMALYAFDIIDPSWFYENKIPIIIIGETICLVLFGLSWLVQYSAIADVRAITQ